MKAISPFSDLVKRPTQTLLRVGAFLLSPSVLVAADRLSAPPPQVSAQATVAELSSKEVKRREENRVKALKEIELGDQMMSLRQYDKAVQSYGAALDLLPLSKSVVRERTLALNGFRDASLQLANVRISEGRYRTKPGQQVPSAEDALRTLLGRDPSNKAALRLQEQLYTPGYFNPTITPEFRDDVEHVKTYLLQGRGFIDSGRFDLALKRADQVLEIDPYNTAARKLQEEANYAIKSAGESGYNEARSRAMRDVQKAWASPVRRYGNTTTVAATPQAVEASQVEKLKRKVQEIILPEVQFTDKSLVEVAAALTEASRAADTSGGARGVQIIVSNFNSSPSAAGSGAAPGTSVLDLAPPAPSMGGGGAGSIPTVTIPKVPGLALSHILDLVTMYSDTKWTVKEKWVEIVPKATKTDNSVFRSWVVNPFFFSSTAPKVADLSSTSGLGVLGGASAPAPKPSGAKRIDAKETLSTFEVKFDAPGSTATYNPQTRTLTVFNTVEMLELVDSLVANSEGVVPVQVDIRAKFIEFSQSNLKELSFDWLLGQSDIPGHEQISTGGGKSTLNSADYPYVIPNTQPNNAGSPTGVNPITAGNRSGKAGLTSSAIDTLLANIPKTSQMASPAAFALAGAFTDPQFQLVVRALNQRKDVDLLSSPSIVARDREAASIDIIRQFRYPTEFSPPQVPTQAAGQAGGAAPPAIVTPTTPSAYETKETGVKLTVTPTIGPDNYAIELLLAPEVTEFEGFINYGSPIQTVSTSNVLGGANGAVMSTPTAVTLTENVINQPIFSVRKLNTNVTVLDGETIALGGLIREDVQKINDKVPILGDIPLLGRLFRSNVDQHIKKNLTIFVTARIIDTSGQPLKSTRAETESEEVPSLTGDFPLIPSR